MISLKLEIQGCSWNKMMMTEENAFFLVQRSDGVRAQFLPDYFFNVIAYNEMMMSKKNIIIPEKSHSMHLR